MLELLKEYWIKILIILFSIIVLIFLPKLYFLNKEIKNNTFIIEKVPVKLKLVSINSKSPMLINALDLSTNTIVSDIKVSSVCPMADKGMPGMILDVSKITSFNPSSEEKIIDYDGLYDLLCTNKVQHQK